MSRQIETLIVDDDTWSLRLVKGMLNECFPKMRVETRQTPDTSGEFDIYFIDNDFDGQRMAGKLATQIRRERPNSLIIAFSGMLDTETLKDLINAGCNGACDKSVYGDLARSMEIVQAYIDQFVHSPTVKDESRGFGGAVDSIRGLLHEWNRRLEHERRRVGAAEGTGART